MTTSDVTISIGGNNVSNSVFAVNSGTSKQSGIGAAEILLENPADTWGDTFDSNDIVLIAISGNLIFSGYVDNVVPYLEKSGVYTNRLKVTARDKGRILTDYYVTCDYPTQEAGVIIAAILATLGDPLLFTDPTGTPQIKYSCKRATLSDVLTTICQLCTPKYDFYVDTTGRIQFFQSGTVDSGINLLSDVGGVTNNILMLEEYEKIGGDIRNYIEVHAGSVNDHWTEENASDWSILAGTGTLSDGTVAAGDLVLKGVASLKLVATNALVKIGLDFSTGASPNYLYSQGGAIVMDNFAQAKAAFRAANGSVGNFSINPLLRDSAGREVIFTRNSANASSYGYTNNQSGSAEKWRAVSFPVGDHVNNIPDAVIRKSGLWFGPVDFDWEDITVIGFELRFPSLGTMDTLYIDSLSFPNIEAKSINIASGGTLANGTGVATGSPITLTPTANTVTVTGLGTFTITIPTGGGGTATSGTCTVNGSPVTLVAGVNTITTSVSTGTITVTPLYPYGKRMIPLYRKDLESQVELDKVASNEKDYRKDPVKKFKIDAIGQSGTIYHSEAVHVRAPSHGVAALTAYTIIKLQHSLKMGKNTRGWDYTTTYDLAEQDVDPERIANHDDPVMRYLQDLRASNYRHKGGLTDEDYWIGNIETGITPQILTGATFPTDYNDGDLFLLTADYVYGGTQYYGPATYKYNSTADTWVRDPMVMYRAVVPPAGGEMTGDYYYNTATEIMYQWTGAAWVQLDFAATVISGEINADQLSIEQRDWKSNLGWIWDVANKDWDEFWWGEADDEKNTDAQIEFSDGTTTTIDKGTEGALADGTYVYYWDENFKAGGTYQLQRDTFTNYANAVGEGKGLVAIVIINEAGKDAPSFFTFNSYAAVIGTGLLSSWAVKGVHITGENIEGKDISTQPSVGEAAGNAGIRIIGDAANIVTTPTAIGDPIGGNFAAGIYGFAAGPQRTFFLNPATGVITVYGTGKFLLADALDDAYGSMNMTLVNDGITNRKTIRILATAGNSHDIMFEASGYYMKFNSNTGHIRVLGSATFDLSHADTQFILPLKTADPGAPHNGELWVRTDL